MKRYEIAKKLGISQSFFTEIMQGSKRPSPKMALKLEASSGIDRSLWLWANLDELTQLITNRFQS